ncbi:MAG: TIGR03086 family metal-binding protein [Ilumatobacteraceae bacterium]
MTTALDLGPATRRMADLVANVPDGMLDAPTPCPAYSLGDLLEHVGGLALAFTAAATKTGLDDTQARPGDASRLGDGWRARIPGDLAKLAEAWRDPAAWTGMTSAGGIEMPGEIAGLVALNEVVVHGWDVAKAAGQPYDGDTASLEATRELVAQFGESDRESGPTAAFGPVVEVPDHATLLDRVIGLNGRDPQWHSPRHR